MLCGHLLLGSVGVIWNLLKFLKFMVAQAGSSWNRMFESSSNIEPDNDRLGNEIPIPNSNIYWFRSSCWNVRTLKNPAFWGLLWNLSIPTSYSHTVLLKSFWPFVEKLTTGQPRSKALPHAGSKVREPDRASWVWLESGICILKTSFLDFLVGSRISVSNDFCVLCDQKLYPTIQNVLFFFFFSLSLSHVHELVKLRIRFHVTRTSPNTVILGDFFEFQDFIRSLYRKNRYWWGVEGESGATAMGYTVQNTVGQPQLQETSFWDLGSTWIWLGF